MLFAIGIKHVGETTAKKLAQHFENLDKLIVASTEEISQVNDVGEKIAESIVEFFSKENNIIIINKLKVAGLQFEIDSSDKPLTNNLQGKTFLFTGSLTEFKRDFAQNLVEQNGGKNISSVSKNLDYLVAGENAGSKLKKAQELQTVKILSEKEFLDLINNYLQND